MTVADETPAKNPFPFDPTNMLQSMLPGLAWTTSMIDQTGRAQAALAAEALHKINAPLVEALQRHRELATSLQATADQMAAMATNVGLLAKQHTELADRLQAGMDPYLKYVDWLGRIGKGENPS
jgi:protein-disulfide isomerase-like protein with CxxC motif